MRRRSDGKTIGGQVAGTGKKRGDRFLVNRHATFFGRGALTLFRPEPGFFLWGLLFVRQSKTLGLPQRVLEKGKINLPKRLELWIFLLTFIIWE